MSDFVVNGKHLEFLARAAARSKRRFASVRARAEIVVQKAAFSPIIAKDSSFD